MDDIVRGVREVREAYGKQFGYDLQAIQRDLKALEQASGRRVVSLPPRRPKAITKRGGGTAVQFHPTVIECGGRRTSAGSA